MKQTDKSSGKETAQSGKITKPDTNEIFSGDTNAIVRSDKACAKIEETNPVVRFNKHRENGHKIRPTIEAYGAWAYAFEYFNAVLFEATLPDALITLTRNWRAWGNFCPDRFENNAELITHEISMNPALLKLRDDREALATFVHEMAHLWRHVLGPLNRRGGKGSNGYHDLVWATKMEELGLLPTNTGKVGGKKTGNSVTHLIIDGGSFDVACQALLASGYKIDWHDAPLKIATEGGDENSTSEKNKPPAKKDRIKFTCKNCGLNAWAKPSARLKCESCDLLMLADSTPSTNIIKTNERITP